MSVTNGQIANATTFNTAFVSRTTDTSTTGKLDLNNSGSTAVVDAQLVINNILVDIANAETDIDNLESSRVFKAASSTDNAIARFDGTTGQNIQNSLVTISDTGSMIIPEDLTVSGNLTVNGTLTSVNTDNLEVEDQNITVNKNGSDITAEGAGITVERVGTDGSLVYEDALASKWKAGALGSEIQLANVSSAQTLTNKTIVAANNTITTAASGNLTSTNINAALAELQGDIDAIGSPANYILKSIVTTKGDLIAATASATVARLGVGTNNQVLTADSAEATGLKWADATGGSGGAKNLITNGSADNSLVTIFVPYADAAASRPVDGTGGSPTVTSSITSTSPLDGTKSFLLTKPASNTQGQGWAVPYTIDLAFKAKVLQIDVDYIVNSGTFVAGSSGVDSDVIVYLYDVTNSILIEPSSVKLLSNSTTLSDKFRSSFQTSATGSSYRLIFHCATTSALAYELKVDNVAVSPSNYVYGTPVTDWQPFTPTGSWTTNTTYTGRWRRVGDAMEIQANVATSGAPTAANLSVNIPSGYSIDTSKIVDSTANLQSLGHGSSNDSGATFYKVFCSYASSTAVQVRYQNNASGSSVPVANNLPFTYGAGDSVNITFEVPIVGFSSSVQMSDQTDTRVVAANITGPTSGSLTTGAFTTIVYATVNQDTHGSHNAGTGVYTVRVPGFYTTEASIGIIGTGVIGASEGIRIQKNGGAISANLPRQGAANSGSAAYSTSVTAFYNINDTINAQYYTDRTASTYNGGLVSPSFSVSRVSGPSAIAASESISARYTSAAGQSISNGGQPIIDFGTKVRDTHGAVTTGGSWKFTAPIHGNYTPSIHVSYANATFTAGNGTNIQLFKNNSAYSTLAQNTVQATTTLSAFSLIGTDTVYLLAGEFIDFRIAHGEGTARSLLADATRVRVSIDRVGN